MAVSPPHLALACLCVAFRLCLQQWRSSQLVMRKPSSAHVSTVGCSQVATAIVAWRRTEIPTLYGQTVSTHLFVPGAMPSIGDCATTVAKRRGSLPPTPATRTLHHSLQHARLRSLQHARLQSHEQVLRFRKDREMHERPFLLDMPSLFATSFGLRLRSSAFAVVVDFFLSRR